jgi:hypothetical protein
VHVDSSAGCGILKVHLGSTEAGTTDTHGGGVVQVSEAMTLSVLVVLAEKDEFSVHLGVKRVKRDARRCTASRKFAHLRVGLGSRLRGESGMQHALRHSTPMVC